MSLKPMQPYLKLLSNPQGYSQVPNISVNASSSTSMVLMIFRFFIQSGEYDFFVKRLKNVSVTKLSLQTVNSNDMPGQNTLINQGPYQPSEKVTVTLNANKPVMKSTYLAQKDFGGNQNDVSLSSDDRAPSKHGSDAKLSNYKALLEKLKMGSNRGSQYNTPSKAKQRESAGSKMQTMTPQRSLTPTLSQFQNTQQSLNLPKPALATATKSYKQIPVKLKAPEIIVQLQPPS